MQEYTDSEIIDCLKRRQNEVVRYLFDRYLPMVRLMVYKAGGTPDEARDIFQDGLIIMIEKIDQGDFVLTCKFKTYLFSVCKNLWLKLHEKKEAAANYLNRRLQEDDFVEIPDDYDQEVYQKIILEVFETLEPACQQILKLYWQEFSPREIAEKLGLTYGYVKKKKCECQQTLLSRIQNHPDFKMIKSTENSLL